MSVINSPIDGMPSLLTSSAFTSTSALTRPVTYDVLPEHLKAAWERLAASIAKAESTATSQASTRRDLLAVQTAYIDLSRRERAMRDMQTAAQMTRLQAVVRLGTARKELLHLQEEIGILEGQIGMLDGVNQEAAEGLRQFTEEYRALEGHQHTMGEETIAREMRKYNGAGVSVTTSASSTTTVLGSGSPARPAASSAFGGQDEQVNSIKHNQGENSEEGDI